MNEVSAPRPYLPAAGHDFFLPFYDLVTSLMGADSVRRRLLASVDIRPGQTVLDIGCGTGTLLVELKGMHPKVEVVGLDPDAKALARASRKAGKAGVVIRLDQGYSDALPYPDASIDHVFSSYMFHHLEADVKERTLGEVRRVLKPGGALHLLDFAGPEEHGSLLARLFHSNDRLKDNAEDRVLALMRGAGLRPRVAGYERVMFGFGRAVRYEAEAPSTGAA